MSDQSPPTATSDPTAAPAGQLPTSPAGGARRAATAPAAAAAPAPGSTLTPHQLAMARELLSLIASDDYSEVLCNGPREVIVKERGQRFHAANVRFDTVEDYHTVLNELLRLYTQVPDRIDGSTVLIEGRLTLPAEADAEPPQLARVHILAPPMVPTAVVTIAKKARYELSLEEMVRVGAMTPAMAEVLRLFARGKVCMVLSGGSGSGKTTLLQALAHFWDPSNRVILIEDTPELELPIADVVKLNATLRRPGDDPSTLVTLEYCVQQSMRMRGDRIIVGEVRGGEMAEWLVAANAGADGSMVTVHAESAARALNKMLTLATKNPTAGSEATVRREIANTVDVIVHLTTLEDGRHVVAEITEVSNTIREGSGQFSLQTLFEFDRKANVHRALIPPSDALRETLAARGIALDLGLFR